MISELYNSGVSFEEFLDSGEIEEKERTLKLFKKTVFDDLSIERIKSIDKITNILVCAEIWCPDCRVSVPVLEKMLQYNDKIRYAIVDMKGNEDFFKEYSPGGDVRIPTFIICSEDFIVKGTFIEHPSALREKLPALNEEASKDEIREYRRGGYTKETLNDILDLIL